MGLTVGVLAFHGDVSEHILATKDAASTLGLNVLIREVRTKKDLAGIDALIIPGGESTTLQILCEREGMFDHMKNVRNIFGTCAGAILLAKKVTNKKAGQRTLGLMNIEAVRNAYGRQLDSAERTLNTPFGRIRATFIRAPKLKPLSRKVATLIADGDDVACCEERTKKGYYLATSFHPELTTTAFHEHFLKNLV